ncbi:MAG: D-alanyl-D-alanine carboxypeptidase/D-alanyl-D-alanine-endopeptidase [Actinobacteria bacterium]|nr:D-alanyl-D-alanine carboxypeptidase/D-alanyl-D-alanine-endopeptidase [Actinomycetota bacterium]
MSDAADQPPAEPVLGEPPVMAHDPVSDAVTDGSVRVLGDGGAPTSIPSATPTETGSVGPVPGLAPDQAAPMLPDAPRSPRRRRRRRGRLMAAALLALGGASLVIGAVATDSGPTSARGAAPELRLATPVLSARRAPEVVSRPVAARAARAAVAPVVAKLPDASCVLVTDGATVLAESASTTPLAPASNTKLLTASAVLSVLGPDTRFTTRVVSSAAPAGGGISGDLYLVGGGDPLLSTTTAAALMRHGQEPTTSLEALADQVVAAGVHRIDGSVVGDGSRYDDQHKVPTWPDRFITQGTVASLGGLVVNDSWTIDPIRPGSPGAAAPDPAAAAAGVFTALLQARGVVVAGAPKAGTAPGGAVEITSMPSLPVKDIVGQMLTFSDNTTAEMMVKELAVHGGDKGSTDAGIRVLVADLATRGMPTEGLVLHDGSGLSRENRVTCRLLDAVLAADGPNGLIAQRLARPGHPGTLDDRFTKGPLGDRIAAKTGTLNDVAALSGWLRTDPGRPLTFSILENPTGRPVQAADLALQSQILGALLSYPTSPPVDQLGPLPPVAT